MAYGAPANRITPDRAAPAAGQGHWGVQPGGPFEAIARNPKPRRGAQLGRVGVVGTAQGQSAFAPGAGRPLGVLPTPSALDYAHKLTTTTLLLLGVVGYVLFGPKRRAAVLSQLAAKHVA